MGKLSASNVKFFKSNVPFILLDEQHSPLSFVGHYTLGGLANLEWLHFNDYSLLSKHLYKCESLPKLIMLGDKLGSYLQQNKNAFLVKNYTMEDVVIRLKSFMRAQDLPPLQYASLEDVQSECLLQKENMHLALYNQQAEKIKQLRYLLTDKTTTDKTIHYSF